MLLFIGFLGNIFDLYLFTKLLKVFCQPRHIGKSAFYVTMILFTLIFTGLQYKYPVSWMLLIISLAMVFIFSFFYKSWRHVGLTVIFWTVFGKCFDWITVFTMSVILGAKISFIYEHPEYTFVGLFLSLALKYSVFYLLLSKRYTQGIERAFSWYQYFFFLLSFVVLMNAAIIFNQLLDNKPISHKLYTSLFISVILFFLSVLYLFDKLVLIAKEIAYNRVVAAENKNQQQFLAEIGTMTEYLKELKHDYRHHLDIIHKMKYCDSDETAEEYVNMLIKDYERLVDFGVINNKPALSLLIMEKIKEAEANGIEFVVHTDDTLETNMSDADLNALLCNLLDNAVEATKDQLDNKKIELNIHAVNDTFFMELSNTYDGELNIRNQQYLTTKVNNSIHGYGLKSVKRIVEANDGMIQIDTINHIFKVLVALPLMQKLKKA